MNTILKNILRFTGLVVGVPVVQPHNLNLNTSGSLVPLLPQFVATNAGGFTVAITNLTVTVTRTVDAVTGTVLVYVEHWHTIEEVLPPGNLATLVPFLIQPGTGGGGGGVDTDGVTIGGDGTLGNALFVIPSGLDEQVAVAVDGVTITGDGTTGNPLVAVAPVDTGITQLTNDVLAGPGSGTQAATVVALQGNPVAVASPVSGQVLTWDGTDWVPGSIPSGGSGGGGVLYYLNEGVAPDPPTTGLPISTNGLVTVKELGLVAEVPLTSVTSSTLSTVAYDLICGFVTDMVLPGTTEIPAGIWDFNIWAKAAAVGPQHVIIQARVYRYDGVNPPTLLATSNDAFIYDPTVVVQYPISVVLALTPMLATDRVYVELRAKAVSGSHKVTFYFGDDNPTHVHTTLPSVTGTGIAHVVNGAFVSPASPVILSSATEVTGVLLVANGGTNTATAPANGELLIGNAGNYTVASLTAGTNIAITPGPGSITIASGPTAPSTAGDVVVAVSNIAPGTQVIAANANRRGLMIGNCAGGRIVYLRLGAIPATATQYAVALAPGRTYELPWPVYTGAIQARASGGGAIVLVQELT